MKIFNSAVVGTNGARTDWRWELCDWSAPYVQTWQNSFLVKAGTYNVLLNYGSLTNKATFVGLRVRFASETPNPDEVLLRWSFEGSNEVNYLKSLIILTSTKSHPIPGIKLANPTAYDAKIDMLVATDDVFMQMNTSIELSTNVAYDDLYYKCVRSNGRQQLSISVLNAGGNPNDVANTSDLSEVGFLQLLNIDGVEISGRTLIIDDTSVGKIFLGFVNEADACQVASEINYATANQSSHGVSFTLPLPKDTAGPVFTFDTTVVSNAVTMYLDGWDGEITKANIIDSLVASIHDARDGSITPTTSMLSITKDGADVPSITAVGTYSLAFTARDTACNASTASVALTVVLSNDTDGPVFEWTGSYQPGQGSGLPFAVIYLDDYEV